MSLSAFADSTQRQEWIKEKGLTVFSLWNPSIPLTEVDLFVQEPFPFDEAFARAFRAEVDGVHIFVASIDDLIELKRRAGRPKDIEDIRILEAIRREEG